MYLRSNVLLSANVFENFRETCLKICKLNPAKFISAPVLVWQADFKKIKVKLELLTDICMLLGGICTATHQYAKAKNKYMKDYDKNKEPLYLNYWDVNDLYGWAMSQEIPGNNFDWIEENSRFNEDLIENYNEESDERYFLEFDVQYPEKIYQPRNDLPFLPEKKKLKKLCS